MRLDEWARCIDSEGAARLDRLTPKAQALAVLVAEENLALLDAWLDLRREKAPR